MRARLFVAASALGLAAAAALRTMGPLLTDTTALDYGGGGCVNAPGDSNPICTDAGAVASAEACASVCEGNPSCSAMTWHGPSTGAWAGHCVLRKDGVWAPSPCGAGCDHTAAQKTSGWNPGAAAVWTPTTKGFTSLPKTFWFGANSSGLDSEETLALIARHDVGGYGWQTGHPGGGQVGLGEMWQAEATTHLQDFLQAAGGNNNPKQTIIFQYRQVQVALRLFAECALAADDPAYDGLWIHDPTDPQSICVAGQPWGTSDPYFDFSNASAIDYYTQKVINPILNDPSLAPGGAVFFDECDQGMCGYRAGSCDFGKLNMTSQGEGYLAFYPRLVSALNSAGIVPILSLDNRMSASGAGLSVGPPCAVPEDAVVAALQNYSWVRFYETWPGSFWVPGGPDLDAAMVANAILEAEAGVPTVLHTGGACPAPQRNITRPGPLGGDIEFAVASYLVVQSPGTTISISNDWYDQSFCWRPDFDVDFGLPLGPPVRTGTHAWSRNYTRATASVDLSQGRNGQVYLLA